MSILTQFVFRLGFGLALAMACTSPRLVASGYFRVHAWVLLGLNVLAAMVAWTSPDRFSLWLPIVAAVASYVASVVWLYEKLRLGRGLLLVVATTCLAGAWAAADWPRAAAGPGGNSSSSASARVDLATFDKSAKVLLWGLDPLSGGLVLGGTMAAMLLGHWYLNAPGMELSPLKRLVLLMGAAIVLRSAVCGAGLAAEWLNYGLGDGPRATFIVLRWLAGLVGTAVVAVMTWETLKVPNTQSATGILYVGVITTFLGELTAQLLSAEARFPL